MKTILSFILIFVSLTIGAQTKKLEVTDSKTGKSIVFSEDQRIKITTVSREKFVGNLTVQDLETIAVNGTPIKLENIMSIKNFPKKGRALKTIVLGTGMGLIAGSAVAAAGGNGIAFTMFATGTGTAVIGGVIGNGNKTYIKRRSIYKIID